MVSPHAGILQALLAPADSVEEYYHSLFQVALEAGLRDPALLLGLLWHAPRGDALQRPDRWEWLVDLISTGLQEPPESPSSDTAPQPFAPLGEQVVIPRYRYEAMLLQLRQLAARAAELEQQLADWTHDFLSDSIPPVEKAPPGLEESSSHPLGLLPDWTDLERQVSELVDSFLPDAVIPEDQQEAFLGNLAALQEGSLGELGQVLKKQAQRTQQEDELEVAIQECLEENPDLAADERKIEMMRYCLKNYVNFHPDLMSLPLKERVAEACRMAREFLGESGKTGT
uniref:Uncharacterized protein n=1 Tax=Desulfobacca acetoxidans TaxID=60893 RepID=A0A7C3SI99_9BACT